MNIKSSQQLVEEANKTIETLSPEEVKNLVEKKEITLIKNEMENVRELYVKGFISKDVYQKETRSLFEMASHYGA